MFAGAEYTLSENPNPGTGYSSSGEWSCDGGVMDATNTKVTVALGAQVTCTIVNTDDTPQLKLVKSVVNDNGGTAVADNWTLYAAAAAPNNGRNFNNLGGSGSFQNVFAGAEYTLSENPNPGTGYSSTGQWSCDGGTLDATKTKVTVALGEHVTCTIVNNDMKPQLKLVKYVVNNDGGTKTAADWKLSAAAASPKDGRNFDSQTATPVFHDVFANAEYTLSEDPNPGTGYSSTAQWTCTGGGTLDATKTKVTVALGEHVTCTITNTDNTPQLKLVKNVINDNGGNKQPDFWTLSASAAAPNNGRNFNNLGGSGSFQNVFGGVQYTLSETPNPGYGYSSTGQWSCDGGTLDATKTKVTVALGQDVTCTITNNDQPGTIIVEKVIKPTGSSTSFTFNTTGTGYGGFSLAGGQQNSQNLNAGSYTVKELVPLGWVLTGIGGGGPGLYDCTVTGSGGSSGRWQSQYADRHHQPEERRHGQVRVREHRTGRHPNAGLLGDAPAAGPYRLVRRRGLRP